MPTEFSAFSHIPIEELHISMRAIGALKRSQIYTLADLMNYTEEDIQLLDPDTGDEVISALRDRFSLSLPTEDAIS